MSQAQVIQIPTGKWRENCYIIFNSAKDALIIDPGSDFEIIEKSVIDHNLHPLAVLNTHGHYDHIGSVAAVVKRYSIPFYLHGHDQKLLNQANLYKLLFDSRVKIEIPKIDHQFASIDVDVEINPFLFRVIQTPGHTAGSVCIQLGDKFFSGDTLLPNGPGRTDLPGGDKIKLQESLLKLRKLPTNLTVYPGHGSPFNLGWFWNEFDAK